MKPLHLRLNNFIGIRSGLGHDELTLDLSDREGLIALVGPNGHGKTTVLDSLHPYRLMPFRASGYSERSFSYYEETVGDALKELVWSHEGTTYRSVIAIKGAGKVKRTSATLYRENLEGQWEPVRLADGTISDGKTETYDTCVHRIIGTPEMFFTAAFSAQERKRLCDYPAGDMKLLLSELLGLEKLLELSAEANEAAKHVTAQAEGLTAQLQDFDADIATLATRREDEKRIEADIGTENTNRAGHRAAASAAAEAVAKAKADQDRSEANERERQRLILERIDIETDGNARIAELNESITAATREGLADDLVKTRDAAKTRLDGNIEKRVRLVRASAFTITPAQARDAITRADSTVEFLDGQLTLARGAEAAASEAAATIDAINKALAGIKREGATAKAARDDAQRRGGLLARVPCAGMEIASTCELLADARTGATLAAEQDAKVTQLRIDYETESKRAAELTAVAAELPAKTQARKHLEDEHANAKKNVAAAHDDRAKADAAQAARDQLEDLDALIAADRTTYSEAAREIALRADAADTKAAELRMRLPALRASLRERLERLDAAMLAIPAADGGAALAAAKASATAAEAALSECETKLSGLQNTLATCRAEIGALEARIAGAEQLRQQARALAEDIGQWRLLGKALGRDGVVALAIDDAGPSISSLTNDLLLACYGPRFTVRFDTQTAKADGSMREDFDIRVFDAERDDEKSLTKASGGERIWINEAITRAIGLYRARASGAAYECFFSDESDGALDPDRKGMFMRMKRKVMELGGVSTEFYITHTPECWASADSIIDFNELRTQ